MRSAPELLKSYTEHRVIFIPRGRQGIAEMESTSAEWLQWRKYRRDYGMGDILVDCVCTVDCAGFSHWFRVPGSDSEVEPVYRWERHYTAISAVKIGQNGTIRPVSITAAAVVVELAAFNSNGSKGSK